MIWPFTRKNPDWNARLAATLKPDPLYLKRREAAKKGWARRQADRAFAVPVEPVPISPLRASIPSRMGKRARQTRNRLSRIIARDGCNCWLCGKFVHAREQSVDHAIPKSRGGTNHIHNLRLAHVRCNQDRGAIQPTKQSSRAANASKFGDALRHAPKVFAEGRV